ncbi:tetrapyrrole methylase family protein / MazG family protein [Alteribacillus persepolensis]|uniref:Tetrapyrrole methylase family protein / MazG family protein n=1 Tax=Alteribacillus persepolensis TaxID=568899 RepID=A0A1G8HZQ6_9BACI|nr:nucleoside triphosphate pyrophosphohydrolase [Alteribacillus persepolensis]SDI12215.1 tetrapyrrole methylase family protein / MazG family protein [Alteribacillus persepolensis]
MNKNEASQRSKISLIGLGVGELEQLSLGMYRTLQRAEHVYVRTAKHPVVHELQQEGMSFQSFDYLYEKNDSFADVYEEIIEELLHAAAKHYHIYYAVPGHPMTAEYTVQRLLELADEQQVEVNILGGQSFLDAMFSVLSFDPNDGFQLLDGTALQANDINTSQHVIISQMYDEMIASEAKLTLMERYPDDYEVTLVTSAGTSKEEKKSLPLYELDREMTQHNLAALYVPPVTDETLLYREFGKLRDVIRTLRGPQGCPWDKQQTHQSLKRYLLEEVYEVLEAIDQEDDEHLQEELGDVLLQVMLHAQIGEDEGFFNVEDVIETLTAKMIRRHPHVFGDSSAETEEEVNKNWDDIKRMEKGADKASSQLLTDIPASLPALMEAYELQKKAAKVGFDWKDDAPMWKKLHEEMAEWLYEIKQGNKEAMKKEFGDLLFVLVNLGRFYKLQPEESLFMTNTKFKKRFSYIEKALIQQGKSLEETSLEEMDKLWDEAKNRG